MTLSQVLYLQIIAGLAVAVVLWISNSRVAQSKTNDIFSRVIYVSVQAKPSGPVAAKQKFAAIPALALSNQRRDW